MDLHKITKDLFDDFGSISNIIKNTIILSKLDLISTGSRRKKRLLKMELHGLNLVSVGALTIGACLKLNFPIIVEIKHIYS